MENNTNIQNNNYIKPLSEITNDELREYLFQKMKQMNLGYNSANNLDNIPSARVNIRPIASFPERTKSSTYNEYGRTRAGALSVGLN